MASGPFSWVLVHERSGFLSGRQCPRSPPPENDLYRLEEDAEIEPQCHVCDVVQVVTHLLGLFLGVACVAIADLGPAGEPWPNHRAEPEVGNRLGQELELRNAVRPGP